ncbi:hypothetical protein [Prevotella sp.]|uniref:hypothetical protein n=1 Tax=Prevotella sp. TaxID=59823 RepID=UPI00402945D2
MITDDFYKKRMRQYYTDEEAFRIVYSFLEDKAKEAKSQGDKKKEQSYQKVQILFLDRNIKQRKEMNKRKAQYEHQKKRG